MTKRESKHRRRELLTLGKRLKSWRKAKGWSQEKLAWAAEIDYSYLNEIENGKINPGVMTLFALAHVLDISPAVFFLPVSQAKQMEKPSFFHTEVQDQCLTDDLYKPASSPLKVAQPQQIYPLAETHKDEL